MLSKINKLDRIKTEINNLKLKLDNEKNSIQKEISSIENVSKSNDCIRVIEKKYITINTLLETLKEYEELVFSNCNVYKSIKKTQYKTFEEKEFLQIFERNYEYFIKIFKNFDLKGINVFNQETISKLNICYNNLADIHLNRIKYVNEVINEDKVKREEISILQSSYDMKVKDNQKKIDELFGESKKLINEIRQEIVENELKYSKRDFSSFKGLPKSFETNLCLPVGRIKSDNVTYDLSYFNQKPLIYTKDSGFEEIDLSKINANIAITYNEKQKNDESLWKIVESLVMRSLISYPSAFKKYTFIHGVKVNSDFLNIIGKLNLCSDNTSKLFLDASSDKKIINTTYEIEKTLQKISDILAQRTIKCYDYDNILEYNKANPFMVEPLVFVFLKDIDENLNQNNIDYIKEIIKKCAKYGVYFVWLSTMALFDKTFSMDDKNNFQKVYSFLSDGILQRGNINIYPALELDSLNRNTYENIKKEIVSFDKSISYTQFHQGIEDEHLKEEAYGKILRIPFGREGQEIAYLELNSQNEFSHVVITGDTGSGKSNLMHSIVLGAAEHYSPNELELWIFDFKQGGVEFEPYSELKHCKYLGLRPNQADVLDILQHIQNIMSERSTIFNRAGVNDIHTYNKENPSKKMTRIITLIDEYGVLKSIKECTNILEDIVRRGRSFGISLMMGSQIIEDGFETIIGQMRHRFLFGKDTNRHNYISEDLQKFGKYYEVIGTCAYSSNKGVSIVRSTKIDDRKELIEKINQKYPEVINEKAVTLEDLSLTKYKVKVNEYNSSIGAAFKDFRTIRLGEQNLSKNTIEYKFNERNRVLTLLGDAERCKNIEYSIINAYLNCQSDEPLVYYLNTVHYNQNDIIGIIKNSLNPNICFTNKPLEVGNMIRKVYKIYQERLEQIYQGLSNDGKPIHLIIHCADRLLDRLNNEKMINESNNYSSFGTDDDIINRIKNINSSNYDNNPSISIYEMMRKLMNADRETKIYITLHFEQTSSLTKYDENSFVSSIGIPSYSDYLILPSIPEEGEQVSFVQIGEFLKNVGQIDLSDAYFKRKVEVENDIKDRNAFYYGILIDDGYVRKFKPYVLEVADNE